jgi:hypothetical protein
MQRATAALKGWLVGLLKDFLDIALAVVELVVAIAVGMVELGAAIVNLGAAIVKLGLVSLSAALHLLALRIMQSVT